VQVAEFAVVHFHTVVGIKGDALVGVWRSFSSNAASSARCFPRVSFSFSSYRRCDVEVAAMMSPATGPSFSQIQCAFRSHHRSEVAI
jgi:hypothetical protein